MDHVGKSTRKGISPWKIMVARGQGEDSCQEWGWSWKISCGQESPDREGGFYFINVGGLWPSFDFSRDIPTPSNLGLSVCRPFDCLLQHMFSDLICILYWSDLSRTWL